MPMYHAEPNRSEPNPPKPTRTYWMLHPRDFANEYTIGIATTAEDAEQYEEEGFRRIDRDRAIRELSWRPRSHEQVYRTVTVNGVVPTIIQTGEGDCYVIARNLRTGRDIDAVSY